jgi:hypothetical protein
MMMDIMYFGYSFGEDAAESRQNETDFIKEIKEAFPNVKLKNAYDEIKGYRQEVWLEDEQQEDYHCFLFGKGWFELSLTLQIAMMSDDKHDDIKHWIELTRIKYPEAFKK